MHNLLTTTYKGMGRTLLVSLHKNQPQPFLLVYKKTVQNWPRLFIGYLFKNQPQLITTPFRDIQDSIYYIRSKIYLLSTINHTTVSLKAYKTQLSRYCKKISPEGSLSTINHSTDFYQGF